ncbi:MAG: glycosyltransferase family 39 protein, partial [Gammaproteobacteria bacterium]|nr:glycosyltransferase family 39 protein [Gammaproteobacteria bacterium]
MKTLNKTEKNTSLIVIAYALFIAIFMVGGTNGPDTYYYWEWSRHLDWSYYDGPPMISYALKAITAVFGTSETSLLLLGLLTILITSYFLYKAARLLFSDDKVAFFSVIIWLSTADVLRHFFLLVTYDTTLILFWALTFYSFLKLIDTKKIRYYYLTGISIGLMLLSKYTGILLCFSLLISCLVYPRYRFVLQNKHFYLSLLIALLLFSPVLLWNYHHHWISFSYQLNKGLSDTSNHLAGIRLYLKQTLINFNVFFLILLFILLRYGKHIFKSDRLGLISIPTVFIWGFFFLVSFKNVPTHGDSWNAECFFTGALLLAFYISRLSLKPLFLAVIFGISLLATLTYLIACRFPDINPLLGWSQAVATKNMLQKIPEKIYKNRVIYHDGQYWLSSFMGYFLLGHPPIYSTNLLNGNQYYFWNKENHSATEGKKVLLFSYDSVIIDKHFTYCRMKTHQTYAQKNVFRGIKQWNLYV